MRHKWTMLCFAALTLWLATPAEPSTGDLGSIIERFVTSRFPDATSHFWVVNSTQWDDDEIVVDVNTVVQERFKQHPTESRFLLLIVEGKVAGAQNIPLDSPSDCQPEAQSQA